MHSHESHEPGGVLLVNPPPASPALPSPAMLLAAGSLMALGLCPKLYDANLELILAGLDADGQDALSCLTSLDFYDPGLLVNALRLFEPGRGLQPDSAQPAQTERDLLQQGLRERLGHQQPRSLVVCLTSTQQLGAARLIAQSTKEWQKSARVVLWGDGLAKEMDADWRQIADAWLPGYDAATLLSAVHAPKADHDAMQGLGLAMAQMRCLAPEPVLPLSILGGLPHAPGNPAELARRLGVRFFLASREQLDLAQAGNGNHEVFLGLDWKLAAMPGMDEIKAAFRAGVRLIRWITRPGDPGVSSESVPPSLALAAKAGMWNHLELVGGAAGHERRALYSLALDNPHLIHSHKGLANGSLGQPGSKQAVEPSHNKPGRFPPLPGDPFWLQLKEPAHLLLQVVRHGVRSLRCLRTKEGSGQVFSLTDDLEYNFVKPDQLTPELYDQIVELILMGGRLKPDYIRSNLERAFYVAYVKKQGVIVATSSVKHPRPQFIQRLLKLTGRDFSQYLERGYISVRPEYRNTGVADYLIAELRNRWKGRNTFLVISADNITGKEITKRNGGKFLVSYFSQEKNKEYEIWTPAEQDDSLSLPADGMA